MRCTNCGAEFEGNICPNCQKPVTGWTDDVPTPDGPKQDSEEKPNEPSFDFSFSQPTPQIKKKKSKEDRKKIARIIADIVGGVLVVTFLITTAVSKSEYGKLAEKYRNLATANRNNETEIADLTKIKNEYGEYKERMKPYEALDEAEAKERQIEADKVAADKKAADEKAAADKKAADEKAAADAAAAKAAAEAQGYETGITYDQLARTPDDFKGKKVKFTGKVIQVMEDSDTINIRLAVNDNYDTILLGEYSPSTVSSRVLENDHITIYGTSIGTISYKSTMGGSITIPGVYISKIDQ